MTHSLYFKGLNMKQHYVIFLSPGTFFSESTSKEIDSWDINLAQEMARGIKERYEATPFGFYFITRGREDNELDAKEMDRSKGIYFLGGTIETLEQVKARNDPKDKILISNMENNNYDKVITNTNSYKHTMPFGKDDIRLDWSP